MENINLLEDKENLQESETDTRKDKEYLISLSDFVEKLNRCGFEPAYWKLVYSLSDKETILLTKEENNKVYFKNNCFCNSMRRILTLDYIISAYVNELSESSDSVNYSNNWFFIKDNWWGLNDISQKCSECTLPFAACPYKMAAFIEWVCKINNTDHDEVYAQVLKTDFEAKAQIPKTSSLINVVDDDIKGIDIISAVAGYYLIKNQYIRILQDNETMFRYSFVPLCSKTKDDRVNNIYEFLCGKDIRFSFFRKDKIAFEACIKRECEDCNYSQCPDRVAAYMLYLSSKYDVDTAELTRHIINKNRFGTLTLLGHLRHNQFISRAQRIPFDIKSRDIFDGILNYVINKRVSGNQKIPRIRFHQAILTSDEELADETVKLLKDIMCFYHYFDSNIKIQRIKYSEFADGRFGSDNIGKIVRYIKEVKEPTIVHIKELELYFEDQIAQKLENKKESILRIKNAVTDNHNIILIISGEKNDLESIFSSYNDFYYGLLQYHLKLTDVKQSKVTEMILNRLVDYNFEDGFSEALENYVQIKYVSSELKSKAFVDKTVTDIVFNHFKKKYDASMLLSIADLPSLKEKRDRQSIWNDINMLTGLEGVKKELAMLEKLLDFQMTKSKISSSGKGSLPAMHMVFMGNPGTGKTTVARLMAEMLYSFGLIRMNKVVEVSAKDMIGQYVGHTAPLTAAKCESAYGGVLFIDEAYNLAPAEGSSSVFRDECVTELIKQMEDNREDLVVVLAGYTEPMMHMLDTANPGLKSRITKFIEFEDYSPQQLVDIFLKLAYSDDMQLSDSFINKLTGIIEIERVKPGFGNARAMRTLYETVIQNHAINVYGKNDRKTILTLTEKDLPYYNS